ncbi:MAG: hypothetical protein V4510_11285 [bacterium]
MRSSPLFSSLLLVALLSASLATLASPAHAQGPVIPASSYDFELTPPPGPVRFTNFPGPWETSLTYHDLSRDSPTSLVPGGSPTNVPVFKHSVAFSIDPPPDKLLLVGWQADIPAGLTSQAGDGPVQVVFRGILTASPTTVPYVHVRVTATITTQPENQAFNRSVDLTLVALGFPTIQTQSNGPQLKLEPRERGDAVFTVSNIGLYPKNVQFKLTGNPCDMAVGVPSTIALAGGDSQEVHFSAVAPSNSFWYQGDNCSLTLAASDPTNPNDSKTANVIIKVEGFYVDPTWIFNWIGLIIVVVLLVFLIRRRKERREERILGKPQKPWLIPVEQVYLRELKARDPRAWYVVRHYLMEEEYRSSLLWFKAFKAATKGDRKKETLILQQEDKYAKWKAKWAKAIAKPLKTADRYEAKLQRKLDRKARKTFRKARRKSRRLSAKIKSAQAKLQKRSDEKWEKQRAKAEKKGRPIPEKPILAAPALPAEAVQGKPVLAEHKWAKRAARYRRRMVRKQGNLEVRFEKADARYLRRIRRKVGKLARKLDDPEFVAEHPLLRSEA